MNKINDKGNNPETPDMKVLTEAFQAFNEATNKLESSYSLLQDEAKKLREEVEEKNKRLSDLSNLLETILMNSNSSITAVSCDMEVLMTNTRCEKLRETIGEESFMQLLKDLSSPGVCEHGPVDGRFFKVSVGELEAEHFNGFVYVIDDITHLKEMEVERQRGEKLQLMGEMAANIAHEIRNPLGSIELFASLLGRDIAEDPDKKRLTDSIVKGVRTINSIISNILLFTKEIQLGKKEHYFADIVDDVVLYMQHLMKEKDIKFNNNIGEDDIVFCDVELMKQVVMNLVHNSIDAVEHGGEITVESNFNFEQSELRVIDNGTGLDKEMAKKLFMPFQTTKAQGTGLGLAIVYKIIKSHGGNIEVSSEENTVFTITLPRK